MFLLSKPVINKYINNGLLFSMVVALFSWNATVRAQTSNVDALVPIIAFILEDDFQCPTVGPASEFVIEDGVLISFRSDPNQRQGTIIISSQEDLNEIDGVIRIDGELLFDKQLLSQEVDFSPLDSLVEVTGNVSIGTGNTAIGGFNCLASVGGGLNIENNDSLENIIGFQSLELIGGDFSVSLNENLISIDGFQRLKSVDGFFGIAVNDSLEDIDGFQMLETIGRSAFMSLNSRLRGIDGFQSLRSIGSDLNIEGNSFLTGFSFPLLETIGRDLNIQDNPSLRSIGSLTDLNRSDVVGDIIIFSNLSFDCGNPVPNFLPTTSSLGNGVNCTQDLVSRIVSSSNDESMLIPDLGSVSSNIVIPAQSTNTGVIRSLEVNLDIEHTSVGDLTVTLSNGVTTIDLLARPSAMNGGDSQILLDIANECAPAIDGDFLSEFTDSNAFISFTSFDTDCVIELLRNSNADSNSDSMSVDVANQCGANTFTVNSFIGVNDFDAGDLGSFLSGAVATNDSINCADIIRALTEDGGTACTSNDIVINLVDDNSLFPVNTSCSSEDDQTAFILPSYTPLQSLSAFEGSSLNETWTLTVTDSENDNVGVLNGWSIVFDVER